MPILSLGRKKQCVRAGGETFLMQTNVTKCKFYGSETKIKCRKMFKVKLGNFNAQKRESAEGVKFLFVCLAFAN